MDTEGLSKLHCIRDMNELERDGFFTLTKKPKNGPKKVPKYVCPKCRQRYIFSIRFADQYLIKSEGYEYYNITPQGEHSRLKSIKKPQSPTYKQPQLVSTKLNQLSKSDAREKNNALKDMLETRKDHENFNKQIETARSKPAREKNTSTHLSMHKTDTLNSGTIHNHNQTIGVRDFVVRRTTFKCLHENHRLQNIDAKINLINEKGQIQHETVSAGYCPNCNIFFIMESTYQKLKVKGTPICRTSDERAYLSGATSETGMRLAQESILMQYGYNVSQTEDLSALRRKKILALLVDNHILTRSDVISYLDFFISQRKHQSRFEKAIEKWEDDREFIENYNTGNYAKYGIHGIIRR